MNQLHETVAAILHLPTLSHAQGFTIRNWSCYMSEESDIPDGTEDYDLFSHMISRFSISSLYPCQTMLAKSGLARQNILMTSLHLTNKTTAIMHIKSNHNIFAPFVVLSHCMCALLLLFLAFVCIRAL